MQLQIYLSTQFAESFFAMSQLWPNSVYPHKSDKHIWSHLSLCVYAAIRYTAWTKESQTYYNAIRFYVCMPLEFWMNLAMHLSHSILTKTMDFKLFLKHTLKPVVRFVSNARPQMQSPCWLTHHPAKNAPHPQESWGSQTFMWAAHLENVMNLRKSVSHQRCFASQCDLTMNSESAGFSYGKTWHV